MSWPSSPGSNDGMSDGHALRQRQEEVDDPLVLTGGNEIEGFLVARIGVRRAHPEPGCVIAHDPPCEVDDGRGARAGAPLPYGVGSRSRPSIGPRFEGRCRSPAPGRRYVVVRHRWSIALADQHFRKNRQVGFDSRHPLSQEGPAQLRFPAPWASAGQGRNRRRSRKRRSRRGAAGAWWTMNVSMISGLSATALVESRQGARRRVRRRRAPDRGARASIRDHPASNHDRRQAWRRPSTGRGRGPRPRPRLHRADRPPDGASSGAIKPGGPAEALGLSALGSDSL